MEILTILPIYAAMQDNDRQKLLRVVLISTGENKLLEVLIIRWNLL